MTLTVTSARAGTRLARGRLAAGAAAALLVANGIAAALGDAVGDHTGGLGALSDGLTGLAFLAGAAALGLLRPVSGWRGALWRVGPLGMTLAGASMLSVPLLDAEPPFWLVLVAVVPTLVGTISAGIFGTGRLWPRWVGVGVALLLPIMFTLPFNTLVMAAIWVAVALAAQPRG